MFQTEPIHYLQSFASEGFTMFMVLISGMGYSDFYIPVIILITLGISVRKGFLITQMMLVMVVLINLLKNTFALPRPADIDRNVQLLMDGVPNQAPFSNKGEQGFFDLPASEAIRFYRSKPHWSYGLPSGHVSGTVTFWAGLSILFKNKILWAFSGMIIILMPLSRMYLGRHFVADVLAGLLLGSLFILFVRSLAIVPGARINMLEIVRLEITYSRRSLILLGYLLAGPLLLLLLTPLVKAGDIGYWFGVNVAFLVIGLHGFPSDEGTRFKRFLRVLLGLVLYVSAGLVVSVLVEMSSIESDSIWISFFSNAFTTFIIFWGAISLCQKSGLYNQVKTKV